MVLVSYSSSDLPDFFISEYICSGDLYIVNYKLCGAAGICGVNNCHVLRAANNQHLYVTLLFVKRINISYLNVHKEPVRKVLLLSFR